MKNTKRGKLPERFLAADPDCPCETCEKVRKTCRYCEKCRECCDCPICDLCGFAEIGRACEEFAQEVARDNDGSNDVCRCEFCAGCGKKTPGDYLCALPNDNRRWCEKCFAKMEG
jgi:hypothetical protein